MLETLQKLMACGQLMRGTKLGPEAKECIAFAHRLRALTLDGTLRCVWLHIPNEGRRSIYTMQILRSMGMHRGAPDYLFLAEGRAASLEFKSPRGRLSDAQKDFQKWLENQGIDQAVVRTAEEGVAKLLEWGLLDS